MSIFQMQKFQEDTAAAIEGARTMAWTQTITPELAHRLAANADWLMRHVVSDLQFADDGDEDVDITVDLEVARKLPNSLATMAKALLEYAELLKGLEEFRASKSQEAAA